MFFSKNACLTMAVLPALALGACSSAKAPSFGQQLSGQGAEVAKIGENWEKGDKLVSEGNALVKSGNKDLEKGRDLIAKGEKKMSKGQAMIKRGAALKKAAEQAYGVYDNTMIPLPPASVEVQ